jgi:predicted O-methyltransferase YrrM
MDVLPEAVERFATAVGPAPDPVVAEMDAYADETGFPTVGPAVGGWLRLLARTVDARRVFEFGSGFGYSAYWFAGALPPDGEVVCCEYDHENLDRAVRYLERGGFRDLATFEQADAVAAIDRYEGPFDVVLVDNEKERYREAFEAVRGKVRPGGLVCADNAMTSAGVDFEDLAAVVEGESVDASAGTRGVADYLAAVREADEFETALLPLGEGLAVSRRRS